MSLLISCTPNLHNGLEFFSFFFFFRIMIQSYTCYITHLLLVKESFSSILYNSLQDQSTRAHYKCSRIFSNNCEEMTHKSPKSKLPNSKNGCHVIPEEEVHKVVMLHLA